MKMKLWAPLYYKNFVCIADRCRHSCCVGWEIDIDEKTAEKYKKETDGYGKKVRESVDFSEIPHFILSENERCPHLDENGLCRIILCLGEDCLCDICRLHPRFYNETKRGVEVGVGMSCEEACRLILSSDDFADFCVVEEKTDGELPMTELSLSDYDPLCDRARIFEILGDKKTKLKEKLHIIKEEFDIDADALTDVEKRELFLSLEYQNESDGELFGGFFTPGTQPTEKTEKKLLRALAYFVYRHCSAAYDKDDFKASLGMSVLLMHLTEYLVFCGLTAEEAARLVSSEIEYSVENTDALREEIFFM